MPVQALTDDAPVYDRPRARPGWLDPSARVRPAALPEPADPGAVLLRLLAAPTIASKRSIWRQYDHMVGINTLVLPGSDAAVLRIKGTPAVAVATDGNGRYGHLDPFQGGAMAVAEAARNVVCAGGRPLAVTNCLNFASPERPEIMWQFAEAVDGIAAACRGARHPGHRRERLLLQRDARPGDPADARRRRRRAPRGRRAADDPVVQGGRGRRRAPRRAGRPARRQRVPPPLVHGRLAGAAGAARPRRGARGPGRVPGRHRGRCVRSAHDCGRGRPGRGARGVRVTGPVVHRGDGRPPGAGRVDELLFGEAPSADLVTAAPGTSSA